MKDAYMTGAGITVVRFPDRDILNKLKAVLEEIRGGINYPPLFHEDPFKNNIYS